jgi:hypothetical protein
MSTSPQRKDRRKKDRAFSKAKYSLHDVQKAMNIAIEMKRLTYGHLYSKTIKSRCVFCGVTDRSKKECKFSFITFLDRLQVTLINPAYFKDNEIDAFFLLAQDEYQDVRVPWNVKDNEEPTQKPERSLREGKI